MMLINWKKYLTIIPRAQMAYGSIAHEAETQGLGRGGVHGISSDGDDRMEPKVKTQKNP